MMSMQRQCQEALDLLAAIQSCVERAQKRNMCGGLIPCRAGDFEVYIERARALVGVVDVAKRT